MLTEYNFKQAAALIGCHIAAIKAVAHQEGGSVGYYHGKVIIKFEGHVFHRLTNGEYDRQYPVISYPKWTERYTQEGELAYLRFNEAYSLDPEAAMMATSWGMFQIMGENYSLCGYKSVNDFVEAMHGGEPKQLEMFCAFVIHQGLAKYLIGMSDPGRTLLCAALFAKGYNGSGYKANHYDTNIAKSFTIYSKQS